MSCCFKMLTIMTDDDDGGTRGDRKVRFFFLFCFSDTEKSTDFK